jgi:hypothetical protein
LSVYLRLEPALAKLAAFFQAAYENRDLKFGNARLVPNVFKRAIDMAR